MTKKDVKKFWNRNKKKVLIGCGAIATGVITIVMFKNKEKIVGKDFDLKIFNNLPTREIPDTDGFNILDIGEDINDGCVVWLDGCKLSDCGKLGEGLSKIERVDSEMLTTMVILGKK